MVVRYAPWWLSAGYGGRNQSIVPNEVYDALPPSEQPLFPPPRRGSRQPRRFDSLAFVLLSDQPLFLCQRYLMRLLPTLLLFCLTTTAAQDVPPWRAVGYFDYEPIKESSGLAASRRFEGVYWTLNDSGNPAELYATELTGKLIRAYPVEGGDNRDWEALAIDDKGQLWIGGIGNNSRERGDLRVYVVDEPDPRDPTASIKVLATYYYSYPAENVDAEGMFVHEGVPHIISKEANRAVLYRFTQLADGQNHTLEQVGVLASGAYRITGAALNKDATMLAAVTYDRLWIYHSVRPINLVNLIRSEPWSMPHDFGVEACAFDGDDLVLSNEARSLFVIPKVWYQTGDAMPPQGALSALDLYPDRTKSESGTVSPQPYREAGIPISGLQLALVGEGGHASMTQTIDITRDDLWEVSAIVTRGPDYGRIDLLIDGKQVGRTYDCAGTESSAGTVATFGRVHIAKGSQDLTLRLISGKRIGLDGYLIQAASQFAQRFMVVGPFDRADDGNIDEVLPPEESFSLLETHTGVNGERVFWKTADAGGNGRLDLVKAFPDAPTITQAYAYTTVYSEAAREAVLLVGADDQIAVWINGVEVHRNNWRGGAFPDEDTVTCSLAAGWNQVLCKVGQNGGNWALYLRFNDPDGTLRYAVQPGPKRNR